MLLFPSLSNSYALGSFILSDLFFSNNESGWDNLAAFGNHTISEVRSVPYVVSHQPIPRSKSFGARFNSTSDTNIVKTIVTSM